MAITVIKSNGDTLVQLFDKVADTTATSLTLFGYGYLRWGEALMRDLVSLLENAASSIAPVTPLSGQLWFNTKDNTLNLWDSIEWSPLVTQDWANSQISNLQNQVLYLTYGADFATKSGVVQQVAEIIQSNDLLGINALADYVTKEALADALAANIPNAPDLSAYASVKFVQSQGYITGNQTISFGGDASGSGTTSVQLSLAPTGVGAGTYTKVTVDTKGRVVVGSGLTTSDLTASLGYTPIKTVNGTTADVKGNVEVVFNDPAANQALAAALAKVSSLANISQYTTTTSNSATSFWAVPFNQVANTGTTLVKITVTGGGGGGGGGSNTIGGGGGGAGGTAIGYYAVTKGQTLTITVGAGGHGGVAGGIGQSGGQSSVALSDTLGNSIPLISATGGQGGSAQNQFGTNYGGAPGTGYPLNGNGPGVTIRGGDGGEGFSIQTGTSTFSLGGLGGASFWGGGGRGGTTMGVPGEAPGSGGGGGYFLQGGVLGGNGATGTVVLEWN